MGNVKTNTKNQEQKGPNIISCLVKQYEICYEYCIFIALSHENWPQLFKSDHSEGRKRVSGGSWLARSKSRLKSYHSSCRHVNCEKLEELQYTHPHLQHIYTGHEKTRLWNIFVWSFFSKTKQE